MQSIDDIIKNHNERGSKEKNRDGFICSYVIENENKKKYEVPEGANSLKIAPNKGLIKFYSGNPSKAIKIPKGIKTISIQILDGRIIVDMNHDIIEKEIDYTQPIGKYTIERNKPIDIPEDARYFKTRKGEIIFYKVLVGGAKEIPENASKIVFPYYEAFGKIFNYGKAKFIR